MKSCTIWVFSLSALPLLAQTTLTRVSGPNLVSEGDQTQRVAVEFKAVSPGRPAARVEGEIRLTDADKELIEVLSSFDVRNTFGFGESGVFHLPVPGEDDGIFYAIAEGTYQQTFGGSAVGFEHSLEFTVLNSPPNITLANSDVVDRVGREIPLFARAIDPGGDPLSFAWHIEGEEDPITAREDSPNATYTLPSLPGTFLAQLVVNDDAGATDEREFNITAKRAPELFLAGSTWSSEFLGALSESDRITTGAFGYRVEEGESNRAAVPWPTVDTIVASFEEPTTVRRQSLRLIGQDVSAPSLLSFESPDAMTAIWRYQEPLPEGRYAVNLASGLEDRYAFDIRPISPEMAEDLKLVLGRRTGDAEYSPRFDSNGSGAVAADDVAALRRLAANRSLLESQNVPEPDGLRIALIASLLGCRFGGFWRSPTSEPRIRRLG